MEEVLFKQKEIWKDYFQKIIGIDYIYKLYFMDANIVRPEHATVLIARFATLVTLTEKTHQGQKTIRLTSNVNFESILIVFNQRLI